MILLKTDLLPYDDVADLFIIDPDGFIIRYSLIEVDLILKRRMTIALCFLGNGILSS